MKKRDKTKEKLGRGPCICRGCIATKIATKIGNNGNDTNDIIDKIYWGVEFFEGFASIEESTIGAECSDILYGKKEV